MSSFGRGKERNHVSNALKTTRTHRKKRNEILKKSEFEILKPDFGFLYELYKNFGGTTFSNGLLRIHTFESSNKWTDLLTNKYYKEFSGKLYCFAFNWQGCMFCINSSNTELFIFDPATCEYFSLENANIEDFFNSIIFDYDDETFITDYFNETLQHLEMNQIEFKNSFGHRKPLFLGGIDDVENYEVIDTEVLWDLQIQIAENINEIPD